MKESRSQAISFGLSLSVMIVLLGFIFPPVWIAIAILPVLFLFDRTTRRIGIGMLLIIVALPIYFGVYAALPGT